MIFSYESAERGGFWGGRSVASGPGILRAGVEVVSPVTFRELDPSFGGGDVHREQVSDDGRWQVGGQGQTCAVLGGGDRDAVFD